MALRCGRCTIIETERHLRAPHWHSRGLSLAPAGQCVAGGRAKRPGPLKRRASIQCLRHGLAIFHTLLVVVLALAEPGRSLRLVQLSDGQQVADMVAAWGATGQSTQLELPPGQLTLQGVMFTPLVETQREAATWGRAPFSSGMLLLTSSQPEPDATVFDAAMRGGLSPPLSAGELCLENFTMVNLCERALDWNRQLGSTYVTSLMAGLGPFNGSRVSQTLETKNMVMYARQADLSVWVYLYIAQTTEFPPVTTALAPLLADLPTLDITIRQVHSQLIKFDVFTTPGARHYNITLKSINTRDDPLLIGLREEGRLMTPQFCNGTLLSSEWLDADVDASMGPIWIAENGSQWLDAVHKAAALPDDASAPVRGQPLPRVVLLSGTANLTVTGPLYQARPVFTHDTLLTGPMQDGRPRRRLSVLDLGNRVDVLEVAANGTLFLARLKITGLVQRPLPGTGSSGNKTTNNVSSYSIASETKSKGSGSVVSALALPFVARSTSWAASSGDPVIWLHDVTLVVPFDDYAAFTALALRSSAPAQCLTPTQMSLLAALQQGIAIPECQWATGSRARFRDVGVRLHAYRGWGINASDLSLQPALGPSDGRAQLLLTCLLGLEDSSGRHVRSLVSITVTLGGVLLLVGLVLLGRRVACQAKRNEDQGPQHVDVKTHEQDVGPDGGDPNEAVPDAFVSAVMPPPVTNLMVSKPGEGGPGSHEAVTAAERGDDIEAPAAPNTPPQASPNSVRLATPPGHGRLPSGDPEKIAERRAWLSELSDTLDVHSLADAVRDRAVALGGECANRVDVVGVIGSGSWGTVFKGFWRGLPVALKTVVFELPPMPSSPAAHLDSRPLQSAAHSRALMEAAIAASVGHRNVVCTYHYDLLPLHVSHDHFLGGLQITVPTSVDGGCNGPCDAHAYKLFLVQELCAANLTALVSSGMLHNRETQAAEEVSVLTVLLDVAHGLQYLHSHGIIHGDLKPDNVLLKPDAATCVGVVAKLADWGLSSVMAPGATHVSNFHSGAPFYVAPEVVYEYRTLPASDIFSFGVIMWQLWAGAPPYLVYNGQFSPNPAFPRFMPPRVPPPSFMQLMARCLDRDPKARPAAAQLAAELQDLLESAQRAQAAST